jgi:glycosyltransferase involved in cell wall biosynthesis
MTVIIPTRDRADVLCKSLQTVTAQNYDNLNIIVSDNFSCDHSEDVARSTGDARVKYINTGKRVSMSHNYEFALTHVTEGWVAIIGDDDGLLPNSLDKVAEIIRDTGTQAIRSSLCNYLWPDMANKGGFGRLGVPLKSGYERRSSELWLKKLMDGQAKYTDMPMLYQGAFINISTIHNIMKHTGSFYRSAIPDVYSGVAIASKVKDYVYSHEPFAINGHSRHSGGGSWFVTTNKPDPAPAQKFFSEPNIRQHDAIPLCRNGSLPKSVEVFVYECYLQSASLRDGVDSNMHAKQLELFLATAGPQTASIVEWGRSFAAAHDLDFAKAYKNAMLKKHVFRFRDLMELAYRELKTARVGSPAVPLQDVYEASIVAAEILQSKPGKIEIVGRIINRIVQKYVMNKQ